MVLRESNEFGSPEWLRAFQAALDAHLGTVEIPADVRFTASETYTDAPPSLGLPGNVLSFHLRVDGSRAQVTEGPCDDAEWRRTGDYNRGLDLALSPFGHDPGGRTRAWREFVHRYGGDAMTQQLAGLTIPPELEGVLVRVHDHMAARTAGNPDTAHRISHLGLDGHRAELDAHGRTVLDGAVSPDGADELRAALAHATSDGGRTRLLACGRLFEEAVLHPWVLVLAEHVLGAGFRLSASTAVAPDIEPAPLVATWVLDDPAGGPPKGSIVLGPAPLDSPGPAVGLYNAYCRTDDAPLERWDDLDPAVLDRNPPQLSTLCRLDQRRDT